MKHKLKPEEERKVTPGPEAVGDLEDLPTPGKQPKVENRIIRLEDIQCETPRTTFEHYPGILVHLDAAGVMNPLNALEQSDANGFLPSSALTCALLMDAFEAVEPMIGSDRPEWAEYYEFLGSYRSSMYHTNTIIDWETPLVEHYPSGYHFTDLHPKANTKGGKLAQMQFSLDWLPTSPKTSYSIPELITTQRMVELVSFIMGFPNPEWMAAVFGFTNPATGQSASYDLEVNLPVEAKRKGKNFVSLGMYTKKETVVLRCDVKEYDNAYVRFVQRA